MSYWHYERLSALDASFVALETPSLHMHVGSVGLYELAPLARPDGSLDFDRIHVALEVALRQRPRFRQKLARVPLFEHPVWVDDERFNLNYHLRHTCLPAPGDERRLKRLAGRIMSQQLDLGKPPWEMWFVEGVGGDRFAVITKLHHCMVDGVSGQDLMAVLMRPDPAVEVRPARNWLPRPAPRAADLFVAELRRRASVPFRLARSARRALESPREFGRSARGLADGLATTFSAGLKPASPTPLNDEIGPHRRFDWTSCELEAVKEVQGRLGGTLNDVVLAVASGALRRFLVARGLRPEELDFRAAVPVNVRRHADGQRPGNRVSSLQVRLPVDEPDPGRRLARVCETTREIKDSGQSTGVEALEELSDALFPRLFSQFARLAAYLRATNLIITNVPGPPFPTYFLGARMLAAYPVVPLIANQALGIAVFSYAGSLFWGFHADWDAVPDLHQLVEWVGTEFELLRKSAVQAG